MDASSKKRTGMQKLFCKTLALCLGAIMVGGVTTTASALDHKVDYKDPGNTHIFTVKNATKKLSTVVTVRDFYDLPLCFEGDLNTTIDISGMGNWTLDLLEKQSDGTYQSVKSGAELEGYYDPDTISEKGIAAAQEAYIASDEFKQYYEKTDYIKETCPTIEEFAAFIRNTDNVTLEIEYGIYITLPGFDTGSHVKFTKPGIYLVTARTDGMVVASPDYDECYVVMFIGTSAPQPDKEPSKPADPAKPADKPADKPAAKPADKETKIIANPKAKTEGDIVVTGYKYGTMGMIAVQNYGSYSFIKQLNAYNAELFKSVGVAQGKILDGMQIYLPAKIGNTARLAPLDSTKGKIHAVKAGETLGTISKTYYGTTAKYKDIFEANKDRIKNINTIFEGQTILVPNAKPIVKPMTSKVMVNGKEITFEAYEVNNNNYFKLRDVAQAVSGSGKQFEVKWDSTTGNISLVSGAAYTPVGGELAKGDGKAKTLDTSTAVIYKDSVVVKLTAYTINDNNYLKLRDLGQAFDFDVSWNEASNSITIDTNSSYTAD